MINPLDKRPHTTDIKVEPNEGERALLSSNRSSRRSPSLDFQETISQEELNDLERLADILAEAIIWRAHNNEQ